MMAHWSWLALTVSLCLWAARAYPAPTDDDSFVVTKIDATDTTSEVQAPSTEGPVPAVKLTRMDVSSEVALRYARTAVVSKVRNPASRAQETTFHVLLPETAFISGFTMTLDGKSYKAYVKEKEEASKIYNEAVSQGVSTALVSAKARDSNHFTVSVNVEPNTEAIFNLTYEELLERRNGVYKQALNLNPGVPVPQMTVRVHIKETQPITTLRVPELRSGNEIDANENDAQNTNAVIVRSENGREATVTFSPDLDEQRRLMAVYAEKTRESRQNARNGLGFISIEHDHDQEVGALGQFVVQYDVDRSTNGEILVNNGYFVHFFAPNLPPLPKHVVFVLDTSGSMSGHKIDQLQEAMRSILSDLNSGDYFNIVEFDSYIKVHDLAEADTPEPTDHKRYYLGYDSDESIDLKRPSPVTPLNIEKAKTIIGRLRAAGGTNIYKALTIAIDLVNRGINPPADASSTTEGTTSELPTTLSVSTESTEDSARPEPIIIFLTDGDPTVGETNTHRIINHVSEKNVGDHKATIFSLAFGEDADRTFLRKLSLRNEGFMRHIYEAADAALQLRDFYRQVASPLLSDVRFTYPPEQVKEDSLTKHKFRTYYLGSEAVVAGQLVPDQPIDFEPTIEGIGVIDDSKKRRTYRLKPKASTGTGELPLERLWAYLTVKQLLDERDAADGEEAQNTFKQRALAIALRYEFVTPLTSLVVVKPNATSAVDPESVDKPDVPVAYPGIANGYSRPSYVPQYQNAYVLSSLRNGAGPAPSHSYFAQTLARPASASFSAIPQAYFGSPLAFSTNDRGSSAQDDPVYDTALLSYSEDVDDNVENLSTPVILSSSVPSEATTSANPAPSTLSPLAAYRLEDYPWAQSLIDAPSDTLRLRLANGTEIALKLAKDAKDEPAGAGEDCTPSTAGGAGACTYLGRCAAARALTAQSYEGLYCVRDGYAGVCCPKDDNSQPTAKH